MLLTNMVVVVPGARLAGAVEKTPQKALYDGMTQAQVQLGVVALQVVVVPMRPEQEVAKVERPVAK